MAKANEKSLTTGSPLKIITDQHVIQRVVDMNAIKNEMAALAKDREERGGSNESGSKVISTNPQASRRTTSPQLLKTSYKLTVGLCIDNLPVEMVKQLRDFALKLSTEHKQTDEYKATLKEQKKAQKKKK